MVAEYVSVLTKRYPHCTEEAGGMASGINLIEIALYIGAWTLGEFAGPLIGGNMMEIMTFERATAIFGYVMLADTAVYFMYTYNHENTKKTNLVEDTRIALV